MMMDATYSPRFSVGTKMKLIWVVYLPMHQFKCCHELTEAS